MSSVLRIYDLRHSPLHFIPAFLAEHAIPKPLSVWALRLPNMGKTDAQISDIWLVFDTCFEANAALVKCSLSPHMRAHLSELGSLDNLRRIHLFFPARASIATARGKQLSIRTEHLTAYTGTDVHDTLLTPPLSNSSPSHSHIDMSQHDSPSPIYPSPNNLFAYLRAQNDRERALNMTNQTTVLASGVQFRDGDWICNSQPCCTHNFSRNATCIACGHPPRSLPSPTASSRDESHLLPPPPMADPRTLSMSSINQVQQPRPGCAGPSTQSILTPDGKALASGWASVNVSHNNANPVIIFWPSNAPFPQPGQVRPHPEFGGHPPIMNTGNSGPIQAQAGDWHCSVCGYTNWRRRRVCQSCFPFADGNMDGAGTAAHIEKINLIASILMAANNTNTTNPSPRLAVQPQYVPRALPSVPTTTMAYSNNSIDHRLRHNPQLAIRAQAPSPAIPLPPRYSGHNDNEHYNIPASSHSPSPYYESFGVRHPQQQQQQQQPRGVSPLPPSANAYLLSVPVSGVPRTYTHAHIEYRVRTPPSSSSPPHHPQYPQQYRHPRPSSPYETLYTSSSSQSAQNAQAAYEVQQSHRKPTMTTSTFRRPPYDSPMSQSSSRSGSGSRGLGHRGSGSGSGSGSAEYLSCFGSDEDDYDRKNQSDEDDVFLGIGHGHGRHDIDILERSGMPSTSTPLSAFSSASSSLLSSNSMVRVRRGRSDGYRYEYYAGNDSSSGSDSNSNHSKHARGDQGSETSVLYPEATTAMTTAAPTSTAAVGMGRKKTPPVVLLPSGRRNIWAIAPDEDTGVTTTVGSRKSNAGVIGLELASRSDGSHLWPATF